MDSDEDGIESLSATVLPDVGLIGRLSDGLGPRPSASEAEREACALIAAELEGLGLEAKVEEFASQRSFGATYLGMLALALLGGKFGRHRVLPALAGAGAAALGLGEARFSRRSPLRLFRRRRSQNVWAVIEPTTAIEPTSSSPDGGGSSESWSERPAGTARTICLVSHMDSSRSGLMFHRRVTPHLGRLAEAASLAVMVNSLAFLLCRFRAGRGLVRMSRLMIWISAGMVLERELRGENVAGANDNASGVAACLNLAAHFSEVPLRRNRLVVLVTGSEESGVFGMREFLDCHETGGWRFINVDGVSAEAPLRVLSREGGAFGYRADAELLAAAEEVGKEKPELHAVPLADGSGLPYDATPVLARGGHAITVVNQEGAIPDYHWPTDTADKVSEEAFSRAVRFIAALVRKLDNDE